MKEYYSKRASEYESIYYRDDPIRQSEQNKIKNVLQGLFKNRTVLEIACGTGYWTQAIVSVAREVTGIDASSEVLEIAKSKGIAAKFVLGNAYELSTVEGEFDSSCANFWFSHIEKVNIPKFLTSLHKRLPNGSIIFMADNVYIPELGGTLVEKPNSPDTYKLRELRDGNTYEIVKNYYTLDTLKTMFKDVSDDLHIEFGQCFWWLTYKTKKSYVG